MSYRYPETNLLYRNLARSYPMVVKARGCWLHDADGKTYLDGCGGAFVTSLGHGVDEIVAAIAAETREVGYVSGFTFTNPSAESLAEAHKSVGVIRSVAIQTPAVGSPAEAPAD